MHIRAAHIAEHGELSHIARAAKAHWGYVAEDLARWEADLTVSTESIERLPTFAAVAESEIVGFCQMSFLSGAAELEHLWVLPSQMGKGVGRALLERAVREVVARGLDELRIDADPHAEGFYLACGAVRLGEKPAPAAGFPERVRPQLALRAKAT